MMKKFVVLMLVLGMASLASAVILTSTDTVTTGSVVWSVSGGQLIGYNATGIIDSGAYWIDGITGTWDAIVVAIGPLDGSNWTGSVNDAAGDLGNVTNWAAGSYDAAGADSPALPDPTSGQWFQFDLSGMGTFGIGQYPSYVEAGTITVIPEPMTMLLLGVGGLFLRRRK